MPPKPPRPSKISTLPSNWRNANTVVVVYMSPGVAVDGGGFVIIVSTDKNGDQVLKIVPVPGGPGDPGWQVIQASAGLLKALDGVKGVQDLRARAGEAIQQQVRSLAR